MMQITNPTRDPLDFSHFDLLDMKVVDKTNQHVNMKVLRSIRQYNEKRLGLVRLALQEDRTVSLGRYIFRIFIFVPLLKVCHWTVGMLVAASARKWDIVTKHLKHIFFLVKAKYPTLPQALLSYFSQNIKIGKWSLSIYHLFRVMRNLKYLKLTTIISSWQT